MDIKKNQKNQKNLFLAMKGLATHTNEQLKVFQATTRKWIDTRTKSCAPDPKIPTQSGINTPASIQMRYIKCLQVGLEGKMDKSQVTSAVAERLDPVIIDQQELQKRLAHVEIPTELGFKPTGAKSRSRRPCSQRISRMCSPPTSSNMNTILRKVQSHSAIKYQIGSRET
jgi:hypothetical protein